MALLIICTTLSVILTRAVAGTATGQVVVATLETENQRLYRVSKSLNQGNQIFGFVIQSLWARNYFLLVDLIVSLIYNSYKTSSMVCRLWL